MNIMAKSFIILCRRNSWGNVMNQENKNLRGPEYYANDDECHEKANEGYIYILTNPSFPNYVKLGYADDVEKKDK